MKDFSTQAKLLRTAREAANITQGELARMLGYTSPQMISNWERELCGAPLEIMPKLCKILGLKPSELVDMLTDEYRTRVKKVLRAA